MPQTPVTQLAPDADQYGDLDTASINALGPYLDNPSDAEHAGVVLQSKDGKYSFTMPISQANDGFSFRAHINSGYKLAGIYHTHPGDENQSQVFSPDDLNAADQLKVPSYVLFQKTGQLRRYTPGQTKTQVSRFGGQMMRTAAGDNVDIPQQNNSPMMAGPDPTGLVDNNNNEHTQSV